MQQDRDLFKEFFGLGREPPQPLSEQEEKDYRDQAKVVYNNPVFQSLMKQFHALEFSYLVEAIGKADYQKAAQHKAALDSLLTVYERLRSLNEEEPNSFDDPYDGQ